MSIPGRYAAADRVMNLARGVVYSVPLESSLSQVPPIYGFDYPLAVRDEGGVVREPEAFGRWGSLRIPLACVIGGEGVPNGDSLRAMSFQLNDEVGWVTVDDLVFQ